jgi:hypothetical protein
MMNALGRDSVRSFTMWRWPEPQSVEQRYHIAVRAWGRIAVESLCRGSVADWRRDHRQVRAGNPTPPKSRRPANLNCCGRASSNCRSIQKADLTVAGLVPSANACSRSLSREDRLPLNHEETALGWSGWSAPWPACCVRQAMPRRSSRPTQVQRRLRVPDHLERGLG